MVSLLALLGPLLCAASQDVAAAPSWSRFRGPAGAGLAADDAPLPARLDPAQDLVWRRPTPPGHSSPCVRGRHVFLTGAEDDALLVLALDRETGAERWRRALPGREVARVHEVNGPASPTPTADGARVYVSFGGFGLAAFDHDGAEVWRRELPAPENTFGPAASPVLAGGRLVVLHDAEDGSWLEALEPATGATLWRVEREGFASGWSTPAVARVGGADQLLVLGVWWLTGYDLEDGRELWAVPGLTDEPITTPVAGDGLVFVTSYNMRTSPEVERLPEFGALVEALDRDGDGALDRAEVEPNQSVLSRHDADGEGDHPLRIFFRFLDEDRDGELTAAEWPKLQRWLDGMQHRNALVAVRPGDGERAAEVVWQHPHGVPEAPSPLWLDGRVYLVKNGGIASCLEARTGRPLYQERLGARGPYYASPVAGDGKLYFASRRGVVTVLAAGDALRVLSQNDLGERIMATPALCGGRVYVRGEAHLYAFGAR